MEQRADANRTRLLITCACHWVRFLCPHKGRHPLHVIPQRLQLMVRAEFMDN